MEFRISRTEWCMVLGILWVEVFSVSSFAPSFSFYESKVIKSGKMKSQSQATGHSIPTDHSSCRVITDKVMKLEVTAAWRDCTTVPSWGTTDTQYLPQRIQTTFLTVSNEPNISELIILTVAYFPFDSHFQMRAQ